MSNRKLNSDIITNGTAKGAGSLKIQKNQSDSVPIDSTIDTAHLFDVTLLLLND